MAAHGTHAARKSIARAVYSLNLYVKVESGVVHLS
jgi:hypothetical protein